MPQTSLDNWTELARRGAGLAHRIRALERDLPNPAEVRLVVDELTALLLSLVAPYFEGIDEIDHLLGSEEPSGPDVRQLIALLVTASRQDYFFRRATISWLEPLAGQSGYLTTPPELIDAGGGYVRAAAWPQGEYLVRMSGEAAATVSALVARIGDTDNPVAIATIVRILNGLPAPEVLTHVPRTARRLATPLAIEYAEQDISTLIRLLGTSGHPEAGVEVLIAAVKAAIKGRRDPTWHLEELLKSAIEHLSHSPRLIEGLQSRVRAELQHRRGSSRYSVMWLKNIDQRPRYGVDALWVLANALYRTLVRAPIDDARSATTAMLDGENQTFQRIALAAIADRPELVADSDSLLADSARWDDDNSTRYEFRRALGSLWSRGSAAGRDALLTYAAESNEPQAITQRLSEAGVEHEPREIRSGWLGRLLHKIRTDLPPEWLAEHGPIEEIDEFRFPEVVAQWGSATARSHQTDFTVLGPTEIVEGLIDEATNGGADLDARADQVAIRASEFVALRNELAGLTHRVRETIVDSIDRALRDEKADDAGSAVEIMLTLAAALLRGAELDATATAYLRSVMGAISSAANHDLLTTESADQALVAVKAALGLASSVENVDAQNAEGGYDAGMLALNSIGGEAVMAGVDLILCAKRRGWIEYQDQASGELRSWLRNDTSLSGRAGVGMKLPWLLDADSSQVDDWLALLFGEDVPVASGTAAWEAYLLYGRFFTDTAMLLRSRYDAAVDAIATDGVSNAVAGRDPEEQLGIHVGLAFLHDLEPGREWITRFYRRASDEQRAHITRWIAEQTGIEGVPDDVATRARGLLAERVAAADPDTDEHELEAIGWISAARADKGYVLTDILLPALEKTGGKTDNEGACVAFVRALAPDLPSQAARALQLIIEGDEWRAIPRLAYVEVRATLELLLTSDDDRAQQIATDVVHTLGARGFLEFRDLVATSVRHAASGTAPVVE